MFCAGSSGATAQKTVNSAGSTATKTTAKATGTVNKTVDSGAGAVNKGVGAATGTSSAAPLPMRMDFSAPREQVLAWMPSFLTDRWKAADDATSQHST